MIRGTAQEDGTGTEQRRGAPTCAARITPGVDPLWRATLKAVRKRREQGRN